MLFIIDLYREKRIMFFKDDLIEHGNMFFREMVQFVITALRRLGPTDSANIKIRKR